MTYEEFTELAKRKITTEEYHDLVEPVYNYHPAIPNKKTAAKLYDLCGLQVRTVKPPRAAGFDTGSALQKRKRGPPPVR